MFAQATVTKYRQLGGLAEIDSQLQSLKVQDQGVSRLGIF